MPSTKSFHFAPAAKEWNKADWKIENWIGFRIVDQIQCVHLQWHYVVLLFFHCIKTPSTATGY